MHQKPLLFNRTMFRGSGGNSWLLMSCLFCVRMTDSSSRTSVSFRGKIDNTNVTLNQLWAFILLWWRPWIEVWFSHNRHIICIALSPCLLSRLSIRWSIRNNQHFIFIWYRYSPISLMKLAVSDSSSYFTNVSLLKLFLLIFIKDMVDLFRLNNGVSIHSWVSLALKLFV